LTLSLSKLLSDYFGMTELKDALYDMGEPISGTKDQLVKRITTNLKSHNRSKYELLDFIDETSLQMICYYYNLDATPVNESTLKNRIKKAGLLDNNSFRKIKSYATKTDAINEKPYRDVHINIGHIQISKNSKIGIIVGVIGAIITIVSIVISYN